MFHNQVLGIIRFSMPALAGFSKTSGAAAQSEAMLYEPARLDMRFKLFEQFCLPTLRNQTDQRFKALILVGRNLPTAYRTRLEGLVATCEPAQILEVDCDRQTQMVTQALARVPAKNFSHRTTFRLDDDDMLDINYVERLRELCRHMYRLNPLTPFAIASNYGYYVDLTGQDPVFYEKREKTPLGLGLSLTMPINKPRHAFMLNHRQFAAHYNTYSVAEEPSFIRTIHAVNDGERTPGADSKPVDQTRMAEILEDQFGVTWESIVHGSGPVSA